MRRINKVSTWLILLLTIALMVCIDFYWVRTSAPSDAQQAALDVQSTQKNLPPAKLSPNRVGVDDR